MPSVVTISVEPATIAGEPVQDQRNTARTRWIASGLSVDFDGTRQQPLAQYGPGIVDRVNFARGRVDPVLTVNASAAREWAVGDHARMRLRFDAENLTGRVALIDFAALLSGNAGTPPRSGDITWSLHF